MKENYFDFFSKTLFSAFYNVAVFDLEDWTSTLVKMTGHPELEGTTMDGSMLLSFLEMQGITSISDRHRIAEKMDTLEEVCRAHKNGVFLNYRTEINGKLNWIDVELYIPEDYGSNNRQVVFAARIIDDEAGLKHEVMHSISSSVNRIAKVYLDEDKITSASLSFYEKNVMDKYTGNTYRDEVRYVADNLIYPEDRLLYLRYMNPQKIRDYYKDGFGDYGFLCRRRIGNRYNWVYIRMVPTFDHTPDNMILACQIITISEYIIKYLNSVIQHRESENGAVWNSEYEYTNYVARVSNALAAFTYSFESFLEVDLKSHRFISFKGNTDNKGNLFPQVGIFPKAAKENIAKYYEGDEAEKLEKFVNLDNIMDQLSNASTLEGNFRRKDGSLILLSVSKVESTKGIPTKANFVSQKINENKNLLKVVTFGNFEVYDAEDKPVYFEKKQSKQVLAYLIDRVGYPISNEDVIQAVLEKDPDDLNARKYASALVRKAMKDLENAGYPDVIIKEGTHTRINKSAVDCDYYHLLDGNVYYWSLYHNEYMKDYSWAEETNSELAHYFDK